MGGPRGCRGLRSLSPSARRQTRRYPALPAAGTQARRSWRSEASVTWKLLTGGTSAASAMGQRSRVRGRAPGATPAAAPAPALTGGDNDGDRVALAVPDERRHLHRVGDTSLQVRDVEGAGVAGNVAAALRAPCQGACISPQPIAPPAHHPHSPSPSLSHGTIPAAPHHSVSRGSRHADPGDAGDVAPGCLHLQP